LPESVPAPASVCARVTCPVPLTAADVNHAGLILTTTHGPPAYDPTDTIPIEVRGVLAPEALPKSPLGGPMFLDTLGAPVGTPIPPASPDPAAPRTVELPVTPVVRSVLANSSLGGFRPTRTIALVELIEPRTFTFTSFVGPGVTGEP